jgi:hypothetical protein
MIDNEICEDILDCKDLWVVLENRYGDQYVESYELPNVLYSKGEFWGKFRNVHSAHGHDVVDQTQTLSYAYNNFSSVVCTCGLANGLQRYYSSYAYSSLNFITKGSFRRIWSSNDGGKISDLIESIRRGLRIKVKIESSDGYTYILPAHTIEALEKEEDFVVETEYDGYPDQLRYFSGIKNIQVEFDKSMTKCTPPLYPSTKFVKAESFFITSFFVSSKGVAQRYIEESGGVIQKLFDCIKAEIWVET